MSLLHYLVLSAALFSIGFGTVVIRRNAIMALVGIELMLNAANINFIAFWRFLPAEDSAAGVLFVLFAIAVAAAEAAVGLALITAIYRQRRTTNLDAFNELKEER